MNLIKCLGFSFVLMFSSNVFSHAGHDHSPGKKDAPKGGIVKESPSYHFEMLTMGQELMFFVYDVEMNPLSDVEKIEVKAFTQLPRQEKESLELVPMKDHLHGKYDKKTAHRYTVFLEVKDGEKMSQLKWVID